jgi:hypothetical protein
MSFSENREFEQTSADKNSATSEDIEEKPELEPQDVLLCALEHNKFERFYALLRVPEVDPRFKYGIPHYKLVWYWHASCIGVENS